MLTACPRCDYDLTGLPETYHCPECGFDYDPDSRSVRLRGKRSEAWQLLGGAVFAGVYLPFWYRDASASFGGQALFWCIAIGLVFVAATAFRIHRREALPERLLLNRHGLTFDPPSLGIDALPWTQIREARCSWADGSLRLIGPDDLPIFQCPYRKLGALRIAKRCAKEIDSALQQYKPVGAAAGDRKRSTVGT